MHAEKTITPYELSTTPLLSFRQLDHAELMQALAAIGQGRLIALWDNLFSQLDQPIAQILLTRMDISDVRHTSGRRRSSWINSADSR